MDLRLGHARTQGNLRASLGDNVGLAGKAWRLSWSRNDLDSGDGGLRSRQLHRNGGRDSRDWLCDRGRLPWGLRDGFGCLDLVLVVEISVETHAAELKSRAGHFAMVSGHHHTFLLIEGATGRVSGRTLGGGVFVGKDRRGGLRLRSGGGRSAVGSDGSSDSAGLGLRGRGWSSIFELLDIVLGELLRRLFRLYRQRLGDLKFRLRLGPFHSSWFFDGCF